ncbi:MAG TPA: Abi family protein [Spirochaetota bacterium]|mgnify:CR=1 FL=1|nr:Abi family protein [Spirochaetota bacterium]HPI89407.1 Abi family protein [Spirochaetota bacterium]HPR49527.1 Abi family protein [Spirochaetota bacterium]
MEYTKPPLTFEQQADKLINRGLIAEKNELIIRLQNVNYYRLSAYLYPFRIPDSDNYYPGTTLEKIWKHYTFDRQLRLIVMDAIERVEVAVRTQLVYHFAHQYGPFEYIDNTNLPRLTSERFAAWLKDINEECQRSRETFIDHFNRKYGDRHFRLPLWMAAEVMSFGRTLTLFNGVDDELRRKIARLYGLEDRVLQSWLGALNVIRNICAHHGRLWNRELGYKPVIPKQRKYPEWHEPFSIPNNRIFSILTILRFMLRHVAPTSNWHNRLNELFQKYPEVPLKAMGFPEDWEKSKLWR